jgi:hypothetical protein
MQSLRVIQNVSASTAVNYLTMPKYYDVQPEHEMLGDASGLWTLAILYWISSAGIFR